MTITNMMHENKFIMKFDLPSFTIFTTGVQEFSFFFKKIYSLNFINFPEIFVSHAIKKERNTEPFKVLF